jgi:hypothetical protein
MQSKGDFIRMYRAQAKSSQLMRGTHEGFSLLEESFLPCFLDIGRHLPKEFVRTEHLNRKFEQGFKEV